MHSGALAAMVVELLFLRQVVYLGWTSVPPRLARRIRLIATAFAQDDGRGRNSAVAQGRRSAPPLQRNETVVDCIFLKLLFLLRYERRVFY